MKPTEGKGRQVWTTGSSPAFKTLFKILLLRCFSFWFNKFSFYLNQLIERSVTADSPDLTTYLKVNRVNTFFKKESGRIL